MTESNKGTDNFAVVGAVANTFVQNMLLSFMTKLTQAERQQQLSIMAAVSLLNLAPLVNWRALHTRLSNWIPRFMNMAPPPEVLYPASMYSTKYRQDDEPNCLFVQLSVIINLPEVSCQPTISEVLENRIYIIDRCHVTTKDIIINGELHQYESWKSDSFNGCFNRRVSGTFVLGGDTFHVSFWHTRPDQSSAIILNLELRSTTQKCIAKLLERALPLAVLHFERDRSEARLLEHTWDFQANGWATTPRFMKKTRENVVMSEENQAILAEVIDNLEPRFDEKIEKGQVPREGILIVGEPGSGKTSTALMIANEVSEKIYCMRGGYYILQVNKFDAEMLRRQVRRIPSGSVVFIDDAQHIFDSTEQSVTLTDCDSGGNSDKWPKLNARGVVELVPSQAKKEKTPSVTVKGSTVSGAVVMELNKIFDGYSSLRRCIVILAANDLSGMTAATQRDGRFTTKLTMNYLDEYQVRWHAKIRDFVFEEWQADEKGQKIASATLIHRWDARVFGTKRSQGQLEFYREVAESLGMKLTLLSWLPIPSAQK